MLLSFPGKEGAETFLNTKSDDWKPFLNLCYGRIRILFLMKDSHG